MMMAGCACGTEGVFGQNDDCHAQGQHGKPRCCGDAGHCWHVVGSRNETSYAAFGCHKIVISQADNVAIASTRTNRSRAARKSCVTSLRCIMFQQTQKSLTAAMAQNWFKQNKETGCTSMRRESCTDMLAHREVGIAAE
jgi:hypothetical protein